ncbi:hypothetical protein [Vibrio sp. V08_P9A1T1]|uniref:hypothetical protein n=1 Tax=Vibrio sp. V08_P9A1T1 TaxID=1938663 RepID=UPI000B8E3F30|nr:hypothetical protein [Vibrio sp. V08_P9A1T1]OXX29104.1 hypothetical protein B9J92_02425 [Vibrio sp. V08_P9A1T1]
MKNEGMKKVLEALRTAIQDAEEFGLVRTENGTVITGAMESEHGIMLVGDAYQSSISSAAKHGEKTIKPVEVQRVNGFWTHPDLPVFGEYVTKEDIKEFERNNNLVFFCVEMGEDASQEFVDEWFEDGLDDCSPWEPTPPSARAFLLSIRDTEDGPMAWFAEPKSVES